METAWTAEELASIERAKEIRVYPGREGFLVPERPDIRQRPYRRCRNCGRVTFTRDDSHDKAVSRAYWAKYRWGPAVWGMTRRAARATTLRVERR
jgi:hypothetical protein